MTLALVLIGALKFGFGVALGVALAAAAITIPVKYWRTK